MHALSKTAMVLAAGLGQRMRPLSLKTPKPLLEVGGKPMIDHALDKLVGAGCERAVVNTHYLSDQIEAHLASRRDIEIVISQEPELLDTGGGIKKALTYFENRPFFALNADLPWMDASVPGLERLSRTWRPNVMDVLLLLMPTAKAHGFDPGGNYVLDADGHARRYGLKKPLPYVWISAQILSPALFEAETDRVFSNNKIWDRAEAKNRLFGTEHDGTCYHCGTPDDLNDANARLKTPRAWK